MVDSTDIQKGLDSLRLFQEFTGIKLNYRARAKFLENIFKLVKKTRKDVFNFLKNELGRSKVKGEKKLNDEINHVLAWLKQSEKEFT